ncbi:MAG: adenylate/guanylate cyclase domain-containing protein [Desulfarculus sp.]|nr:adenylate/guanylate cyclase domain-containing protein [Pseudomonadota bacterium]MBU4597237.1 adenylate/guanylate cyclase domain-containing protein [Pseudomonadota bacterium]MBV1737082.1 adenylate/guanylate cyclase domain-containing protein [Desulfarculus sp.]
MTMVAFVVFAGLHYFSKGATALHPLDSLTTAIMIYNSILAVFFILFIVSFYYNQAANNAEASLVIEKARSDELASLLKKMFGRYLSNDVMDSIIENPSGLELGGEKRRVTIMMTDLRGFTALSERLEPEQVVQLLNTYFEIMVDLVLRYDGTINEIIGDALLVIFGAPKDLPDRTQHAVACAIEMQNAMQEVNLRNRAKGLPELEMGVALNDTEVIVGNVGSNKRSKYAVVGSGVNLTGRIESYTIGGQILVSESVYKILGGRLRVDGQKEVFPKGAESPLRIYEVGGIAGGRNLVLEGKEPDLTALARPIPVSYSVLDGKDIGKKGAQGMIVHLSAKSAEIDLGVSLRPLTNLKMNLEEVDEDLKTKDFYGKIIDQPNGDKNRYLMRFTALPPEIKAYFHSHRQHSAG